MPINFSDLVSKVEAQNEQNRQKLVAQVMPAVDLMVKRREYDYENEQAAASMATIAGQYDVPFTPVPGAGKDMQNLAFSMAAGKKAATDKEADEQAKKQEAENNIKEMLFAEAEVNSDFKPILESVKDKPLVVQQAAYKKYLSDSDRADEWADWKKKADYSASIAMQKSENTANNNPPKTATPTQVSAKQAAYDKANSKVVSIANEGEKVRSGKNNYMVRAGESKNGIRSLLNGYSYDGKNFYKNGKVSKPNKEMEAALKQGYNRLKTLLSDREAAKRILDSTTGSSTPTTTTKPQPANSDIVKSLVGKY